MPIAPRPKRITEAEYLAIEAKAEFKSEFYDGVMYPLHEAGLFGMAGASGSHNTVNENLSGELFGRLKGGPCRTYSRDVKVRVGDTGMYAYPDVVIVCGKPDMEPDQGLVLNPKVIFEVLSPGTERYDRGGKFAHYQRLASVTEYVLVSQDRVRVERFVRQPGGSWTLTTFDDPAGEFALETVPVRVPLADIYRDVEFPEWVPLK